MRTRRAEGEWQTKRSRPAIQRRRRGRRGRRGGRRGGGTEKEEEEEEEVVVEEEETAHPGFGGEAVNDVAACEAQLRATHDARVFVIAR